MGPLHLRRRVSLLVVAALCLLLLGTGDARADGDGDRGEVVLVPDVRNRRPDAARRLIESAGLKVGKIYEVSTERILREHRIKYPVGYVYVQQPEPGVERRRDQPVNLLISAVKDGALPPGMGPKPKPRVAPDNPSAVPPPAAGPPEPPVAPPAAGPGAASPTVNQPPAVTVRGAPPVA